MTTDTLVYRGAKLPFKILEEYKDIQQKNEFFEFKGLLSTSLKKEDAIKFIFTGLKKEDFPVLY